MQAPMNGRTDRWEDGWSDRWIDGRTDDIFFIYIYVETQKYADERTAARNDSKKPVKSGERRVRASQALHAHTFRDAVCIRVRCAYFDSRRGDMRLSIAGNTRNPWPVPQTALRIPSKTRCGALLLWIRRGFCWRIAEQEMICFKIAVSQTECTYEW